MAYDFLGRRLPAGLPGNVSAACIFAVLPAGSVNSLLTVDPPPGLTADSEEPLRLQQHQPSTAAAAGPSTMVLECLFDDGAGLERDTHIISGNGTARELACYCYNFGPTAQSGTVSAAASGGAGGGGGSAAITPNSWSLTVPAGGRTRFAAHVAPPSGRSVIDGDAAGGGVTLTAKFSDGVDALLYFRVAPDISTLTPASEQAVAGSATDDWSHNIAPGGKVTVQPVQPPVGSSSSACVRFTFEFGAGVTDAWAFPQLGPFNATSRPPSGADGIRFSIAALQAHHGDAGVRDGHAEDDGNAPLPPGAIKEVRSIFFTSNGTQFNAATHVNVTDTGTQEVTLLLRDAAFGGNGPPPPPGFRLDVARLSELALGLNLENPAAGFGAQMDVCDLRWVRF